MNTVDGRTKDHNYARRLTFIMTEGCTVVTVLEYDRAANQVITEIGR